MKDLFLHLRLGYVLALPIAAGVASLIVAADFWRFANAGGDLRAAIHIAYQNRNQIELGVSAAIVLLILLPLALGVMRVRLGSWRGIYDSLGMRARWITVLHIGLSTGIGWAVFVAASFPQTMGPTATIHSIEFAFQARSPLLLGLGGIDPIWKGLMLLMTVFAPHLIRLIFHDHYKDQGWFSDYLIRARLADLHGEFYPTAGRHSGNFNCQAMAPAIRAIRRHVILLEREYQSAQPGSMEAARFLTGRWSHVRQFLFHLFVENGAYNHGANFFLFGSTSRALHALIMSSLPAQVLISPFEHPTERELLSSLSRGSFSLREFEPDTELLANSESEKINRLAASMAEGLLPGTNVVLLSDVCWSTGLRVNLEPIISRLRDSVSQQEDVDLRIIVDGAHAIGNVESARMGAGDAYVFSGHKWLLAEIPSGIVYTNAERFAIDGIFDAWGRYLPKATANHATLLSLEAALIWRKSLGQRLEYLNKRSIDLRDYFLRRLPKGLELVGTPSSLGSTKMVAVRPSSGYKWNTAAIREALSDKGLSCEVVTVPLDARDPKGANELWVRVGFPFYSDTNEVNFLLKTLESFLTLT